MSGRDLATLTVADFAALVGEGFALAAADARSLTLVLRAARELEHGRDGAARAPFALTFAGPAEPLLAQQIVPLEHPALGRLELFLVPLGRDADGVRYEAIFS